MTDNSDDALINPVAYTIVARHKLGVPSLERNTVLQGIYKHKEDANYVCLYLNKEQPEKGDDAAGWEYTVAEISKENRHHDAVWVHKFNELKKGRASNDR